MGADKGMVLITIATSAVLGVASFFIAKAFNRNAIFWGLISFLLPVISFLILLVLIMFGALKKLARKY